MPPDFLDNPGRRGRSLATEEIVHYHKNPLNTATLRFWDTLNDFLPINQREGEIVVHIQQNPTIKHLIEALGVPHVEVGAVTVNGEVVSLAERVHDGDRIEVRTAAPGCPIEPRFLLDSHLGRLAAYLRMLGFDCLYNNDYQDDIIANILAEDTRILLSRDRRLLMRKVVQYGYCLRSLEPQEQLTEVVRRFDLADKIAPFHRCLRCNAPLEPVSKEAVLDRLEPLTKIHFDEFHLCPACDQIFWKGSHVERMEKLIDSVSGSSKSYHKGISYG